MRLSNVKTREEIGFNYVLHSLNLITPFGKKISKELKPFSIGQEHLLREELKKVEMLKKLVEEKPKEVGIILEIFMLTKDCYFSLERSKENVLSVVELFEIKSLLLNMNSLIDLEKSIKEYLPPMLLLEETVEALNILDPRKDRLNTFYIYDEFSERIGYLHREKREIELAVRKIQKEERKKIQEKYGIALTPKFDYTVSKSNVNLIEIVRSLKEMKVTDQDYMSISFTLEPTEQVSIYLKEMDELEAQINEEEFIVRENISYEIANYKDIIIDNCRIIGDLDFNLAKAIYAKNHNCVIPEIKDEHIIEFEDGRHLKLEDILRKKNIDYCPVSVKLIEGVTCITGANMGGKTISLKLVGLIAMLAQYGFFVPCKSAKVGLSNYIRILVGDSQSIERGLSSFGSEMEELKEMLDLSQKSSLLLVDEIASGTNPIEGLALTKSIVEYLKKRDYITLVTTHFDSVTDDNDVKNMQVTGLANTNFTNLERELKYANRKDRINIISKYMDYSLAEVKYKTEIPKDALNIAKMLGVYDEIIDCSQEFLKNNAKVNRR